jgi:hypothetical protein
MSRTGDVEVDTRARWSVRSDRSTIGWRKSVGRSAHLGVSRGYARTTNDSTATGRPDGGSALAPREGRVVFGRQDELGLRGREVWPLAVPPCQAAHTLHATDARRLAGWTATAIRIEDVRLVEAKQGGGGRASRTRSYRVHVFIHDGPTCRGCDTPHHPRTHPYLIGG